ncbi:hypothetical protein [Polaromonas sp. SM01]|uniref:hypothetical protein n=1 Tax=Polaromonas sp. SM01 TaxID=3085630 RepID=UPI0029820E69|nr:hypothetical protein [Polaromonas sp. SM01]MDW5441140.1 hypothetical protein [Polaromonas sp. SM01]
MKRYDFQLDTYQSKEMLRVIRSKRDVIETLMHSMKLMMLPPLPPIKPISHIVLQVSKMSRLFFLTEKNMFSVSFPFVTTEKDGALEFRSIHHEKITSQVASQVLAILGSTDSLDGRDVYRFADPIIEVCEGDEDFWCFFRELLMHEDGYIRYDSDPARENGQLHPLHHLDIFYSSSNTFKIGMTQGASLDAFLDVLDVNTNCHYLSEAK